MRAPFIAIEGLDRSGKSTQASLLLARLQSEHLTANLIQFPGQQNPLFAKHTAKINKTDRIERLLPSGTAVICDRYASSGTAFSAAKGLPLPWCRAPDVSLPPTSPHSSSISPPRRQARARATARSATRTATCRTACAPCLRRSPAGRGPVVAPGSSP
jgi:thymidylate kinase